jgi:hypothetical protein
MNQVIAVTNVELRKLSDDEVVMGIKKLANEERRITSEILHYLREVESRMIFAKLAYSSLYEFCVKQLHYSEGSAYRRISAMRVLKDLSPVQSEEVESKINEGAISITNLSLVHSFLKTEKKESRKIYSASEKMDLISSIEHQSKRETEKRLAAIQPKILLTDSERVITETLTEIKFLADDALMNKLTRVRELISNANSDPSYAELLHKITDDFLKRNDPLRRRGVGASKFEIKTESQGLWIA